MKNRYIASFEAAQIASKEVPAFRAGDTLRLEVELTKIRGRAGIGKGIAYVDGMKACEAELTFMIG